MADWIQMTESDLSDGLTSAEKSAMEDLLKATGQDTIAEDLANLTAEVRGFVAAHAPNVMSADASKIPPVARRSAIAILRHDFLSRFPVGRELLTEARVMAYDNAYRTLRGIAKGEPAADIPSDPEEEPEHVSGSTGVTLSYGKDTDLDAKNAAGPLLGR